MFRFSIRQLVLMTASIAAGFVMSNTVNDAQVLDSSLMAFLLGVVSLLLAVGLVQQIVWPPATSNATAGQRAFRRIFLTLLLLGMVLGVYRTCVPYSDPATNQLSQNATINSELALPLWYFSLTLAMMTAPWNSGMGSSGLAERTKKRNGVRNKIISAAVVIGVFVYCLAITNESAFIFSLVDLAIQGMFVGLSQGPAVGTSHYVEYFVRTPQQFRDFVQWQTMTWPLALAACFGLIGWGATLKSKWWWLVLAVFMMPASVNLFRLLGGQAKIVFPMHASLLAKSPIPDAMLGAFCFLLAVFLLATKPTASQPIEASCDQPNSPSRAIYASDHSLIGWGMMAIGMHAIVSLFQDYGILQFAIVLETLFVPDQMLGPLMLFIGMQWQWRRFRFQEAGQERWPCIGNRQYFLIPLVAVVLLVTALTSIPFGIAILHFGL